jgi:hypothetical protein
MSLGRWAYQGVRTSWEVSDSIDHVRGVGRAAVMGAGQVKRGMVGLHHQAVASGGRHAQMIVSGEPGEIATSDQKPAPSLGQTLWTCCKGVVYVVTALAGFATLHAVYRDAKTYRATKPT